MATRGGVQGLGADEVQAVRDGLAAGRRPKVVFTAAAGQVAGQVGQVVALTDPAASEEWVVVRFGRDELPFSPTDLQLAPKVPRRRAEVVPVPPEPGQAPSQPPEFVLDRPPPAAPSAPAPASVAPASVASPPPAPAPAGPARRAEPRRGARAKPPAALTVTLAYADGEWTVAAQQGAKALARPYVVRAAEALRMVALVDVPGVREAVEQIVAGERAEAEQQAQRLRTQLAEVEARLVELRDAG